MTVYDVARGLPDIAELRARCQSLAMLDAVLSPEWQYRWYSFDSRWAPGEAMASMRNGSGDAYSIVFGEAGAFIRGFDHDSPMSPYALSPPRLWPGVVDDVPASFSGWVCEPAFSLPDLGLLAATVCLWRHGDDDRWHTGRIDLPEGGDPDGSASMFALLVDATPAAYQRFAEDYYEITVDVGAVENVYALRPLTADLVHALNPGVAVADLVEDITEIGYPSSL